MYTKIKSLPEGVDARNWPGIIHIDPDCDRLACVWARERYEAGYKLNPANVLRLLLSEQDKVNLKTMSYEVGVQAAISLYNHRSPTTIRFAEAQKLLTSCDEIDGFNILAVIGEMLKHEAAAKEWVHNHDTELLNFMDTVRKV